VADVLRLGTRGSALAVAQSTAVARDLEALGAKVEIVTVRVSGDEASPPRRATSGRNTTESGRASAGGSRLATSDRNASENREASAVEDKARFVKELEQALLDGEIDLAVHSAKDVPGELPDGLEIVAVPERADPRDALCLAPHLLGAGRAGGALAGRGAVAATLDALPEGARVGTASLRRRAELLALRPDLDIRELRGNVDTRLRRLAGTATAAGADDSGLATGSATDPPLDAIVLAAAGLARLGRAEEGAPLSEQALVPAAGQGCLALEARAGDDATRRLACRLTDPRAFACLSAERALVTALGATCHTPVGAHATIVNHTILQLDAFIGTPDGTRSIREEVRGLAETPRSVGADAADRLTAAGAPAILAAAETFDSNA
jgi:hydroxymethylbilane synthase